MNLIAHVFVFIVSPTPGSTYFEKVGKTIADVWVCHLPKIEAEAKARAYILEQSWIIQSDSDQVDILESEIHRYRLDAQASFRQAKEHGISAVFVSSPLADREDNTVEIHHMAPGLHRSDNTH
ncbi:MAG: hypothetical protein Q7U57_09600 [Methylovulum sp.]|nr:hypothetical protein [Methylovulum sp.]